MPTYTCTIASNRWTPTDKQNLVDRITEIHSQEGKAPAYLVQVVFHEIPTGNWFINRRLVPENQIWISGLIRAGRTDEQRTRIAERLMNECAGAVGVEGSYVWAYVCDAEKTAEFGGVLPEPGEEKKWLEGIPRGVRERYGLPLD